MGSQRIDQRLFPLPLTWCQRSTWRRADMESAPTEGPEDPASPCPAPRAVVGRDPRVPPSLPAPAGAAPSEAESAEREAGANAILHPICPPHGLYGPRVFRLPEQGARQTGPSTPVGPIRSTPAFAKPFALRARFGTQCLFFWTVHGPFVSGPRAAASGGWPPTRACGRSLFGKTKRKWGVHPPGTSRPPPPVPVDIPNPFHTKEVTFMPSSAA